MQGAGHIVAAYCTAVDIWRFCLSDCRCLYVQCRYWVETVAHVVKLFPPAGSAIILFIELNHR